MGDLVLKGATSGQITVTPTGVAGTNTLTLPAKTGNIITSADSGTVTGTMLASATVAPANLSTGAPSWNSSGDLSFNSGYGSAATAYGCRAWVNFNGTGTIAIRASGNVTSITDRGTGLYTVNFTSNMPDANYSAVVTIGTNLDAARLAVISSTGQTTSTFPYQLSNQADSANVDASVNNLAFFR